MSVLDWAVSGFGASSGRNAAEEVAPDSCQVVSYMDLGAREGDWDLSEELK